MNTQKAQCRNCVPCHMDPRPRIFRNSVLKDCNSSGVVVRHKFKVTSQLECRLKRDRNKKDWIDGEEIKDSGKFKSQGEVQVWRTGSVTG